MNATLPPPQEQTSAEIQTQPTAATSSMQKPAFIPDLSQGCENGEKGCEAIKPAEPPVNWFSKALMKSYLSSFNICMTELGWVPESILDVGCGNGDLIVYAGQTHLRSRVAGVEFDEAVVEKAKETHCCKLDFRALKETESLPFEDNSFDVVVSHGFLDNTKFPRHWIKEMARVSAEGLIISTRSQMAYSWMKKPFYNQKAELIGKPVFNGLKPYGLRKVKYWLKRYGLEVEVTTHPLPFGMIMARKPQNKSV